MSALDPQSLPGELLFSEYEHNVYVLLDVRPSPI
jgi:hypothetical protein